MSGLLCAILYRISGSVWINLDDTLASFLISAFCMHCSVTGPQKVNMSLIWKFAELSISEEILLVKTGKSQEICIPQNVYFGT